MAWLELELAVGLAVGVLSLVECRLLEACEPEPPELVAPERAEPDVLLELAAWVAVVALLAPGRLTAIAPAASRLAAVALTATARIRASPRSLAATDLARSCCCLSMPAVLRPALSRPSASAMREL